MIGITFSKRRAQALLKSIAGKKNIPRPSSGEWTPSDAAMLLGVAAFALLESVPLIYPSEDASQVPREELEARMMQAAADVHACLATYAGLVRHVRDGTWTAGGDERPLTVHGDPSLFKNRLPLPVSPADWDA